MSRVCKHCGTINSALHGICENQLCRAPDPSEAWKIRAERMGDRAERAHETIQSLEAELAASAALLRSARWWAQEWKTIARHRKEDRDRALHLMEVAQGWRDAFGEENDIMEAALREIATWEPAAFAPEDNLAAESLRATARSALAAVGGKGDAK